MQQNQLLQQLIPFLFLVMFLSVTFYLSAKSKSLTAKMEQKLKEEDSDKYLRVKKSKAIIAIIVPVIFGLFLLGYVVLNFSNFPKGNEYFIAIFGGLGILSIAWGIWSYLREMRR